MSDSTPLKGTTRGERTARRESGIQQQVNELRERRFIKGGREAAWERDITVRGESIFYWAPVIEQLKRAGDLLAALDLAWECMEVAEVALDKELGTLPPGWTLKTAVICRKLKRYDLEIYVLELYLAQVPPCVEEGWASLVRQRLDGAERLAKI